MKDKLNILVVEDEAITAQCLKLEITSEGYNVDTISNGSMAINIIKEKDINLVIMDLHLSGDMDGINTMNKIRGIKDIPVIFITGYNDQSVLDEVKQFNPIGVLIKPIIIEELKNILSNYSIHNC